MLQPDTARRVLPLTGKDEFMKHLLIATAAAFAAANASAQSTQVTLFGVMDASVTRLSTSGGSITGLSSGELSSSRFGVRGTEDLGGGLQAGFWLEAAVAVDNGNGSGFRFDRRSTISLIGNLGEVRLGRDKLASYLNIEAFDPFGDIGVGGNGGNNMIGNAAGAAGTTEGSHPKRTSNTIAWLSPTLAGFHGQIQYGLGESTDAQASSSLGDTLSLRLGYKQGLVDTAIGYGVIQAGTATEQVDYDAANVGFSYDLKWAKATALYATQSGAGRRVDLYTVGAIVPVGTSGEIRASFTQFLDKRNANADSDRIAIGYIHSLSRRTALYALASRVGNDSGARRGFTVSSASLATPTIGAGTSATGYSIGIRHQF